MSHLGHARLRLWDAVILLCRGGTHLQLTFVHTKLFTPVCGPIMMGLVFAMVCDACQYAMSVANTILTRFLDSIMW